MGSWSQRWTGMWRKSNTLPSPTHSERIRAVQADPSSPSGSEQSERIRAESDWFPLNSDHIPTIFLPHKKKVYKSHSEFIPSSFRPTYRFKKKTFLPSQNAKFRPNSDQIPSEFWDLSPLQVHSESIPSPFRVNSESIPSQFQVNSKSIPSQFRVNSESIPSQFQVISKSC